MLPEILRDMAAGRRNSVGDYWSRDYCDKAATEIEALRAEVQRQPAADALGAVRVNDVLLRVSDEDLLWCKDTIAALQEAGGPTNNMRAVGLSRLIAALEAALGQGKA